MLATSACQACAFWQVFLAVPWVCLQFVIVVFSDHSHLLFLMAVCIIIYEIVNVNTLVDYKHKKECTEKRTPIMPAGVTNRAFFQILLMLFQFRL